MLPAVTAIASQLSCATSTTIAAANRLVAYSAAYPLNKIQFNACDMQLVMQTDASFNSRSKGRSVAGAIAYLTNTDTPHHINGSIWNQSAIIPVVCASAAEAEYAALFMGAQQAAWLRTILQALGYPQRTTPILCDNSCAVGIATDTVKIKRTKSIDLRFHWVRDRVRQGQFAVLWSKGTSNLADFFTKPLSVKAHQITMPYLVVPTT
jgi:hypothetical protein